MKNRKNNLMMLLALPAAMMMGGGFGHAQDLQPSGPLNQEKIPTGLDPESDDFPQGILFPYPIFQKAVETKMDRFGSLNYLELRNDKNLARFIRALGTADVKKFPEYSETVVDPKTGKKTTKIDRTAEMTFWINAYNAHFVRVLAANANVKSPDDIKDLYTKQDNLIAGTNYSFKELRAKIIAMDKRAFFALIDGTRGGPRLPLDGVYFFSQIDKRLDNAVAGFVQDERNVKVIDKKASVSEAIMGADALFKTGANRERDGGVRSILITYSDNYNRKFFATSPFEIKYVPADRTLNSYSANSVSGE